MVSPSNACPVEHCVAEKLCSNHQCHLNLGLARGTPYLLFDIGVTKDEGAGAGTPGLPYHMAGQQLRGAIQPDDHPMLHVAPVLVPQDCTTTSRNNASCRALIATTTHTSH